MAEPAVLLRPMRDGDHGVVQSIFSACRVAPFRQAGLPDAMIDTLMAQQWRAQQDQYRHVFPDAVYDLVVREEAVIGYLFAVRGPDRHVLIDIALRPDCSGMGIGSALVAALLAQAGSAGQKVSAHVARDGRAWALWQRMGFRVVGDDGVHYAIEWSPRT